MEDSRPQMRAKKFLSSYSEDPKKQREEFMISLRKKKRAEIFNSKRNFSSASPEKEKCKILAEIDMDTIVETSERFAETLCLSNDRKEVLDTLSKIHVLIANRWNPKFYNVFINKTLLNRFNEILKLEESSMWIYVLKILTNICFEVDELDNYSANLFFEDGLFDTILDCLFLPDNTFLFNVEKWSQAITLLANLVWVNGNFRDKMMEWNILSICKGLLEVPELNNNDKLTSSMISLIDFILRCYPENLAFEEVNFIQFVLEEKVHHNSEYTINVLNLIMNLSVFFKEIRFDISIIQPIVELLSYK